jgi:hypothetical protein
VAIRAYDHREMSSFEVGTLFATVIAVVYNVCIASRGKARPRGPFV